jgi:hypothetical protein
MKKPKWEKELKKKAKKLADNLELCFGERKCKVCGAEPEKQADIIRSEIARARQVAIKEIKEKKFPRGERQWCIECANRICKFIKESERK